MEVAEVILSFHSDRSSWITGVIWDVDGGVMASNNKYLGGPENAFSGLLSYFLSCTWPRTIRR